ncbi:hypothetical protein QCA50_009974 [Cerrena zonata]|uniref:Uncharacterized protein n=1 Tax=Cerrena zonata TaxID=2478898 RepID=A0AAW0G603_9APHY
MYGSLIDQSVVLEEIFTNLSRKINTEIKKCKEANEIGGHASLSHAIIPPRDGWRQKHASF